MTAYLDTSALAKWYLNEPFAEEFEAYVLERPSADISRLTVVELRCVFARRRRAGDLARSAETRAYAAFEQDVSSGFLRVHPVTDQYVVEALALIDELARVPLRTLDALHLAVARGLDVEEIATADRVVANAAKSLGLRVVRFF